MEQLIAQLAQAMAQSQGNGFSPDMMAQAGGATNIPIDPASSELMGQEQMRSQSGIDEIAAMMGHWPIGQVGPIGANSRQVGGPQTNDFMTFDHNGQQVSLPPLATEDSDNGYWDGSKRGNGKGQSFYVIDGQVYPFAKL